ncbi:PDZ domain-containing protein [Waterburya agarophytonicola K14]|uniref:Carboxyl-terminal-processing protease n=1 Tax=Waterburya agarophytonicola KI4 TaxID=2874699 RepID=A0A964FF73_9CYAN|nr:carboxyl-terminal processing protease CtpB [Waterburya agarophytonicola]MCC0177460.1 PDZ domain-containing protein [Waterburya agarophytonicola KI4]
MNYSSKGFGFISNFLKSNKSARTVKLVAALVTTSALVSQGSSPVTAALEDSPKNVIDEVWQIVNNEYVDREFNHVDWKITRQDLLHKSYSDRKAAYKAIRQSLQDLGDPYTRFLEPKEYQELTSQTSGELSGIGIRLGIDKKTSKLTIVEPIPNSPASEVGLKSGDRIVSIDGKPTELMTLEQASAEIKGEVGTEVELKIVREGEPAFEVAIARAQIELPSVSYNLKQEQDSKVGYIKLDEFSSHAAEQMQKAIEDLSNKQASGFILDLRGNPGGLLFSSVEIARMWMKEGAIVSTIDRKGGNEKFSANGKSITDLPLVVLVDGYSASASEILAGALKENHRAKVVGSRTYGKGTVQSVHALSDGSGLAVTIARYYPPSGIDINKKGIAPDIKVDLSREEQTNLAVNPDLIGTTADPQYKRAVSILKGEFVSQTRNNSPKAFNSDRAIPNLPNLN